MLDRTAIDPKYSVLDHIPRSTQEQLRWYTNIFVAADLTEYRSSLTDYPSITVTYNFLVRNVNRTLFTEMMDKEATWMLPYFPNLMELAIVNNQAVPQTIGNVTYPTADYYLVYTRGHFVYREANDLDVSAFDEIAKAEQSWIAPCYEAVINPRLSWVDVGECRDGSEMQLSFRFKGESEKALTHSFSDEFDFQDALQTPVSKEESRHQKNYEPHVSGIYTYQPRARMADEAQVSDCKYLLEFNPFLREDYMFKGIFMDGKGSATAGNYVSEDELHRIEDDTIMLEYSQGAVIASVLMRKVEA